MVDRDGSGVTFALPSSNSSRRGPHRGCAPRIWQISASIRGVQLAGLMGGPVRMVSQPGQPLPLIPAQPAMHRLAGHPIPAGHLGNRRTRYDFHDRVIALLHDAQLHEHGPATLRREQHHDGACPGGRCQASGEATVSTISRSRTAVRSAL